ncbi:hypothetical protein CPC08DRAFT_771391 [Agrocybe pediades]|nr:hypothetical protein CPC08DRAFT_771391 [Agrocybe pediades]
MSTTALATNFEQETIPFAPAVVPEAISTPGIACFDLVEPQSSSPSEEHQHSIPVEEVTSQAISLLEPDIDDAPSDICAFISPGVQESKPTSSTVDNSPELNVDSLLLNVTQSDQSQQLPRIALSSQESSDSTALPEKSTIDAKSACMDANQELSSKDEIDKVNRHQAHRTTVPFVNSPPTAVTTGLAVIANVLLACFWILLASVIMISSSIVSITPSCLPSIMPFASLDTVASSIKSAVYKSIFSAKTSFKPLPSTKEVTSINIQAISTNHLTSTLASSQTSRSQTRIGSILD